VIGRVDVLVRAEESPVPWSPAWSFNDALRRALLARLGERMLTTRWAITPEGREALAAEERAS
jgi:hypothetical protein